MTSSCNIIFITCKQLHKFLRNRTIKQDLINAGSQINAVCSDLLYGDVVRGVYSVIYGIIVIK